MPTPKSVFKIRNQHGLFSTGGVSPTFTKKGKTWSSEQQLRSHLTMVGDGVTYPRTNAKYMKRIQQVYGACEIVRFEVVESEEGAQTVLLYESDRQAKKK